MKRVLLLVALLLGLWSTAHAQVLMPGPSGTLLNGVSATGASTAFANSGYGIVTYQVISASQATGTLIFEGSMDNTNWSTMNCWITGGVNATTSIATSVKIGDVSTRATVSSFYSCNVDGIPLIRANLSTWGTGTWTVNIGTSALPRTK